MKNRKQDKKKTVLRVIAIILAVVFVLAAVITVFPINVGADYNTYFEDKLIRVGIYHGAGAVSDVSLTSDTGFEVGVFDDTTKVFTVIASSSSYAVKVFLSNGNINITTPEWSAIYTHSSASPIFVRAAGQNNKITASGYVYTGILEFKNIGEGMQMVNIAYLEDYVKGVVVSEVYTKWPAESLKSQAVVARSYTLYTLGKRHAASGFDLCNTTCCQAYLGIGKAVDATNAAVDETKGLIVAYGGKPALTTYHSNSGESNENASSAWGSDPEAYPYLSTVHTGFDETASYVNGVWSFSVSASELTEYVNSKDGYKGILKGNITDIKCESINGSEYVYKLILSDAYGNKIEVVKSTQVRNFLVKYCKSACFKVFSHSTVYAGNCDDYVLDSQNMYVITAQGQKTLYSPTIAVEALSADGLCEVEPTGERVFTITGKGYGHGVGMSQYGAMTLAERGCDYNYILGLYYPGTEIVDFRSLGIN
jgi:stage II sporulation protein D